MFDINAKDYGGMIPPPPKKIMQIYEIKNAILLLNTWSSQTLDTTPAIIYPVDATINSAWANSPPSSIERGGGGDGGGKEKNRA